MGDTACWVLTDGVGDDFEDFGEGVPHFPSEKHAAERVSALADGFKPRQLDHVCVIVACSCCEVVYDEEEEGVAHFESRDEAEKMLAGFWDFTDGVAKCEYCKTGPCDREAGEHG